MTFCTIIKVKSYPPSRTPPIMLRRPSIKKSLDRLGSWAVVDLQSYKSAVVFGSLKLKTIYWLLLPFLWNYAQHLLLSKNTKHMSVVHNFADSLKPGSLASHNFLGTKTESTASCGFYCTIFTFSNSNKKEHFLLSPFIDIVVFIAEKTFGIAKVLFTNRCRWQNFCPRL